jgi:hypothetical protein
MDDHRSLIIKFISEEISNIELKCIKYWTKEAYQDNVLTDDFIKWIKDKKNIDYKEYNHEDIRDLYFIAKELMKTKKNYQIKKEIKKEAKVDPRFQAMAEEIDILKSEVQVLKKICIEKNQ